MQQITIRLPEEVIESLEAEADDRGVSRSEHIREVLDSRHDVDELRAEVERLENEKRLLIADREERTELVRYVEGEREWREQPLSTRLRWWVFGRE